MTTYKAMYRCRLCGKVFFDGSEKDEHSARACINLIVTGIKPKYIAIPPMLYKHDCGEPYNGIGLAGFIGFIAKEDDTNAKETNRPPRA